MSTAIVTDIAYIVVLLFCLSDGNNCVYLDDAPPSGAANTNKRNPPQGRFRADSDDEYNYNYNNSNNNNKEKNGSKMPSLNIGGGGGNVSYVHSICFNLDFSYVDSRVFFDTLLTSPDLYS